MKRIDVEYNSGESRIHPGTSVDYMLVIIAGAEIYSELPSVDGDENANYEELKYDILCQIAERGYPTEPFKFWYD